MSKTPVHVFCTFTTVATMFLYKDLIDFRTQNMPESLDQQRNPKGRQMRR